MSIDEKSIEYQEENKKLLMDLRAKWEDVEKNRISVTDFSAFRENIEKRMEEMDKAIARMKAQERSAGGKEEKRIERKCFEKALRYGIESLAPDERKVLTISDPTTGGFLAPSEFTNEMIKGEVEWSPLRSVARVVTTRAKSKQWPKKSQSVAASWVSEIGKRTETQGLKWKLEDIPTHELYALSLVSKQDLEDSVVDIEGMLRDEFAEQFGVSEGTAFITGTGVGKPEGILGNSEVGGFTGVTTSAKIVADDLKRVLYALKEPYAKNAVWLWNRKSTLAIALLKDADSGDYLWRPGLELGSPANVLGLPYLECPDMPEEGASAKAVAVGDFKRGYIIVDRVELEIMADPYTSKSTGCVEYSARRRVGGQVVLPEAIKIYTLKA